MPMIQVTNELKVNPAHVASTFIDHRFYMNGSATYLVITMADGKVHRIEHGWGVDVFAIEKKINEAQE